ncbi:hemagglutinin repeat-containing protein [Utexia brackfieldae]|uniref:two-partner secretion domain-containing protein n=1 Tax=Utexia brackfieldae TaxID=3074108 RepID=UPI00370D4C3E
MNKHFYRVIFNRARGMLMVVSELADSHSTASHRCQKTRARADHRYIAKLSTVSFLTSLSLGVFALVSPAEATTIRVDPNADKTQRPTVIASANGTTQVNIQTPNSQGLSHNRYTQFDVSKQGVILNNSNHASQTEIGGYIKGNEFLTSTGGAKIILNEVNSTNPSQIAGFIEVAGQRAQVIIANGAGITCNGCGFINASRGTLTTGKPIIDNGQLQGYQVEQGHISIEGNGLDSTRQDYTDIIARTVSINAEIHAQDLTVVTGRNKVSADAQQATKLADDGSRSPQVALDVSAIGGMFAGKIKLMGTEGGVGVHNAGSIGASVGSVVVSADGRIENTGNIVAQDQLVMSAGNDILNTGTIGAIAGTASITSQTNITNQGQLSSEKAAAVIHADNTITNTGKVFANNQLKVTAGQTLNNLGSGSLMADHIRLQTTTLNNLNQGGTAPAIVAHKQIDIAAQTINNQEHALIYSDGDINIGGQLATESGVTGQANELNNHSSNIEATNNIHLLINQINNINDHFATELQEVSREHIVEYQLGSSYQRYQPDEVSFFISEVSHMRVNKTGQTEDSYYKYDYERVIQETVVTETDPAKIIAGKDITIVADHLLNDKSQIVAGGGLSISANQIDNIDVPGERHIIDNGTAIHYYRIHEKKTDRQGTGYTAYQPTKVENITLTPSDLKSTTTVSDSGKDRKDNVISQDNPEVTLPPPNSLFQVNPNGDKGYLIETDPQFVDKNKWLGSDYMITQLKQDPENVMKRLGDGYYEQKLVRDQIIALTGQRYLDGYSSDLEQYKALMDAGVEFANSHHLSIGVALSAEQMQALTSDIVWLVAKTVTLPDGSQQQVLVPQVYSVVKAGDLTGSGALLAGREINLNVTGDINNQGRLIAANQLTADAQNINNQQGGNLQAKDIALTAQQDINNIGGHINAEDSLKVSAGRDINISSTINETTTTAGNNTFVQNTIGSVGSLSVANDSGQLSLSAGHDVNLKAAQVTANGQQSQIGITAGHDVNVGVVTTTTGQAINFDSDNYNHQTTTSEVGSHIAGNGNMAITSGHDIAIKGAQVNAQDKLTVDAGHDLSVTEANQHIVYQDHSKVKDHSGGGTSQTVTTQTDLDHQLANGSQLSGGETHLTAGGDMLIQGSQVTGKTAANLDAGGDVTLTAAQERFLDNHFEQTKKSGLMSGGGIGFSYGQFKESTDQKQAENSYLGSTVGSTEGSVKINAGRDVGIAGSDVIAKQDIDITGHNVKVSALDGTTHYQEEYKMEQTGLTVGLTGTVADIYQAKQAIESAKARDNDTLTALQAIKGGLTVAGGALDTQISNQQGDKQASIGVSASFGSQKTERTTNQDNHTVAGAGISAGQNVTINATGNAAKTDGDITVQGSQVAGGKDVTLTANRDVNVLGAVNTQHTDKTETSSGSSVGVGVSVGGNQPGISYNASANYSRERENAEGSSWTQGTVQAGNHLTVKTGQDANLIGGQLTGDSVTADIGHNLNIQSLQDSDNYDYEKLSGSVSGSVGNSGWSANLSETKTDMNSKWASVVEQSGIFAGKGGYDVTVDKNTDLTGAVIASKAEDKAKNKLDTGTISFNDIENKADYQVNSETVNIGMGTGQIATPGAPSIYHNGDSASSTTKSAVEAGKLTIRDKANQQQDVADLSRDTADANNPLAHIFDKQKELDKIEQQQLVNDIAAQAKDIANKYDRIQAQNDLADKKDTIIKDAEDKFANMSDDEKRRYGSAENYANQTYYNAVSQQVSDNARKNIGGIGSSVNKGIDAATSVITGLLTGNIAGGLAGASAPYLAEQIKLHTGHQERDGRWTMDDPNANLVAHAILGAVVAQLQGNSALAGAAGAAGGELIANKIRENLYGDRKVEDLTETEKQNISNLTQLATGLATALASGGDMGDTGAAVSASKNAVENNNIETVLPFPIGQGTVEVASATGQVMKELQAKCGSDCSDAQYLKAMQDAGIVPRDALIPPELGRALFEMIPIIGDYASIRRAIENDDYESLLLTVTQVSRARVLATLGKMALSMGKSSDSLPPEIKTAVKDENSVSLGAGKGTASKISAENQKYVDILSPEAKQHILYGDKPGSGGHLYPGQPGKTPFPESWSADKIVHEVGDIATSPNTTWYAQTGTGGIYTSKGDPAKWVSYEIKDGVRIRVVYQPAIGKVVTAFPDKTPMPNYKQVNK